MDYADLLDEIRHIRFSSLPFSREQGIPTQGSLLKTLEQVYKISYDIYPFDHVPYYYTKYGHESFISLLSSPREIQKREYVLTPVNRVRGQWGSRAINKIIKTQGKTVRDKIAKAKNVEISKSIYTSNSLENQALVECVRKYLPLLYNRPDLESEYKELKRLFKRSGLENCSPMRTKNPNSKLMYDVHYRKIWKIYNNLNKLESLKKLEEKDVYRLTKECLFLKILSKLTHNYNLVVPEEVIDFSKSIKTSINLLSYTKLSYENIKLIIDNNRDELTITLGEYKIFKTITNKSILGDDFINDILKEANISTSVIYNMEFVYSKKSTIPYYSVDLENEYISYLDKGFSITPQLPYGVKDINAIEPFSLVDDSSKAFRLKRLQGITDDFITLTADSLEADNYTDLTKNPLPMSVALLLSNIEDLDVGRCFHIINTFSNPVSETELVVEFDFITKEKYFLRKIPVERKDIKPISEFLNLLIKDIPISFIEYLIKEGKGYLYDIECEEWKEYMLTECHINEINDYKSQLEKLGFNNSYVITHPLLSSKTDNIEKLHAGSEVYKDRRNRGIICWKEEIISFDMYTPNRVNKQINKLTLIDKNDNLLEPKRGVTQKISKDNVTFILPCNKNKAIIPLLFNNEKVKYAEIKIEPILENEKETIIDLGYNYGSRQPYSLRFIDTITDKIYDSELKDVIDIKTSISDKIPESKIQIMTYEDVRSMTKKDYKFFSPNYASSDSDKNEIECFLQEKVNCIIEDYNKYTYKKQENDRSLCKCGRFIGPEYWESLISELNDHSSTAKIKRRYAIAVDKRYRKEFLKRIFCEKCKNINSYLWSLSYAVWYKQGLIKEIFDSKDMIPQLNKLLGLIEGGFKYIKSELNENHSVSNFPSLLLLAILKLRNSENKEIRDFVSLGNPIIQKLLFKFYDYDIEIRELRKTEDKGRSILYTDGFDIDLKSGQDLELSEMEKHNYLIHKFLIGDNPLISVDMKG